ncbi:SusC/RagA family TonB-linked outer membrane protein [Spirosoma montaniterrae]|uniref:SusC/RagA family TonB-linked outer membrane protein n=1 Tax=Spirosoma montaniterrae TaxID=1178516 RepID=A0A1P9X355_9BACT|nr:TonB-dependent receptor [Spirosoma montaniterrae]AQG82066.1 hypothetical protein AWR27_23880 [Spirosoma montaniterrae]
MLPSAVDAQVLASTSRLNSQRPELVLKQHGDDGSGRAVSPKMVQLKVGLARIEKRYGVSFIYRSDLVDTQVLNNTMLSGSLTEDLNSLLQGTDLISEPVRANFYIIRAKGQKAGKTLRPLKRAGLLEEENKGPFALIGAGTDIRSLSQSLENRISRAGLILNELVQDRVVTGRITDESGAVLAGASIAVKGTNRGTSTNSDGSYSINVPSNNATLIFSYIGYVTQEIAVGNQSTINVSLASDVKTLQEVSVVNIGYGTVRQRDLASSVAIAGRKEFGDVNVSDANQLLQGKLAGVNVTNNNGLPGSGTKITIRGVGSFTNSDPLYVIDGIQGGDINSVSPYDIENVTVLKDAATTAIYGAAAANGVVIVTTKRGKSGTPKLSYTGYVGVAQPWRKLDMLNATQYVDLVGDIQTALGGQLTSKLQSPDVRVTRTDWQNEIYRNGRLTEHYLNLTGGSEKSTYSVSMGYTNQQAIMRNYDFERINLRAALEQTVGRFKFGQNINFRYTTNRGNTASFADALRMPPYAPTTDPTNLGGFSRVTTTDDLNDAFNPLATINLTNRKARFMQLYTQLFGEWRIMDGLTFRTQASINFGNYNGFNFQRPFANGMLVFPRQITEYYGYDISPLLENYLTYDKTFGRIHNLNVVVGNTYVRGALGRSLNAQGNDLANDEIQQIGVSPKTTITSGSAYESARLSYFGRVNYTLMDRYIFTASFRRDGSPNFGATNRFGNFPGFGFAWIVSEEPFLKNIPAISNLKVRASWGKTGNDRIPFGLTEPTVWRGSPSLVYSLGTDGTYTQGATVNSIAAPSLRWEETTQTNVGVDVTLFNKIGLTVDYYNRNNNGLLLQVPIPPSTGVGNTGVGTSTLWQNAASAFNRGVEFTASYRADIGKLRLDLTGNAAYNKNQVTSLGGGVPFANGSIDGGFNATRTEPGFPLGYFYGYRVDRVVSSVADLRSLGVDDKGASTFQDKLLPGDFVYRDINGDGRITPADQTFLGSPIPKWTYGGNINLRYGPLDAMIALQGVAGVEIYNALNYWLVGMTRPFNASTQVLRRWRQDGDVTDVPRAGQNANLNTRPSSYFVENGAFMRVRNITIGYSLPNAFLQKSRFIQSVRLYATLQNALTFTRYTGYDPEISSPDPNNASAFLFSRGVDRGQYPQPRTYMIGLQANF